MPKPQNVKKTVAISFATQYVELVIQFVAVMLLARLLSPEQIGTFSVAAFLMTLLHVFRDFGVSQYIIQERDLDNQKIRSAMGVAIVLALAVAALLLAFSGMLARYYGHPEIKNILYVMAASFAVSPFGSLLLGVLRRNLELDKIFYVKTGSALCHVTVALTLAYLGFGAISLAWANFAGILAFGVLGNLMRPEGMPWLPSLRGSRTILSYGSIASLGNAANIAGTNMPDLVLGKTMNMAAVGFFSRGNGLVQLFTRLITSALLPLALPYFAQMRREGKELAEPYLLSVSCLTALSLPFFAAMLLLAFPIMRTLYGPQWDASVPVVQFLCIAGAIGSVSLFGSQVMAANAQVREATWSQLIAQPFRVALVFIAAPYGLAAVALSIVGAEIIMLAVVSGYLYRTIRVTPGALLAACGKSVLVALGSAAVPLAVRLYWGETPAHTWPPLLLGGAGATLGWIGTIILVRHPLLAQLAPRDGAVRQAFSRNAIKLTVKRIAYAVGLVSIVHRLRNRRSLTVAMFHRVLPAQDARQPGADPEWTMAPQTFANCLKFFQKHYHVVTPEQVFAALRGESALPPYSLLVTFDDGWADTVEHAMPILDQHGIQALVFVNSGAVNQTLQFWEERIYSFLATETDGPTRLQALLATHGIGVALPDPALPREAGIRQMISELGKGDRDVLEQATASLLPPATATPAMIDTAQFSQLLANGHSVGGHGKRHQPLTTLRGSAREDLLAAQAAVAAFSGGTPVQSMSFPHGAFSAEIIEHCHGAGYRHLFSSESVLNVVGKGGDGRQPVGRIHISERTIVRPDGRFEPVNLAATLFVRPHRSFAAATGASNG